MNARWLWLDFIEAPFALTAEQKSEIRRVAKRFASRRGLDRPPVAGSPRAWWYWWFVPAETWPVLAVIVVGLFGIGLLVILARMLDIDMTFGLPALGAIMWVATTWAAHRAWQPWYRLAMHTMDLPICAACGYDLSGIADDPQGSRRCPECGWMRPRRDDPPHTEWSENDRHALREMGYTVCRRCGGLLNQNEKSCSRCGDLADA